MTKMVNFAVSQKESANATMIHGQKFLKYPQDAAKSVESILVKSNY